MREKVFVHNNAQIMERKMWQFILGSTGFILYFIYDINSVRMKNAVLQKFFAAGSILVVVSLIAELYAAWGSCQRKIGTMTGFGLGGFLFLCLLIYTLFFALPFEETYCEENKLRAAYTEGMYGLCRHPGVLWFAGAYLCMWGMVGGWKHGIYFLLNRIRVSKGGSQLIGWQMTQSRGCFCDFERKLVNLSLAVHV